MSMNSVKFNEEKSQSWVIAVEALIVGAFVGYQASNAGATSAAAFAVGLGAAMAVYTAIVLVAAAFWLA